jgi:hypothetical protein
LTFAPQQPFVVESFKNCEGLGRVAIMEGKFLNLCSFVSFCLDQGVNLGMSLYLVSLFSFFCVPLGRQHGCGMCNAHSLIVSTGTRNRVINILVCSQAVFFALYRFYLFSLLVCSADARKSDQGYIFGREVVWIREHENLSSVRS